MTPTRPACAIFTTLLAAALLAGCNQQYANYPEIPSARGIKQDPNTPGEESAMVTALQYVANRYAPSKLRFDAANAKEAGAMPTQLPLVVNLPQGLRRSYYERIARKVGPNVRPMTPDAAPSLPVYHVTRIWLRFGEGWVDVMRPMPELPPGTDGKPVYQTVTLKMQGGIGPWRVLHARAWEPGLDPVPEPYYVPDIERINQYKYTVHGARDAPREMQPWIPPERQPGTPTPPSAASPAPVPPADAPAVAPPDGTSPPTPPPVDLPGDGPIVKPANPG